MPTLVNTRNKKKKHQRQLLLLTSSFSVDRGWHTQTHIPSLSLSQTCSFCFSASSAQQRRPWPCFQARLVAMAKLSSEYYGLSPLSSLNWNYSCSVCVCVYAWCACMFFFKGGFSILWAVLGMAFSVSFLENPGLNLKSVPFHHMASYRFCCGQQVFAGIGVYFIV